MMNRALEFGWFLPTAGDSTAFGVRDAEVEITPEYLLGVVEAYGIRCAKEDRYALMDEEVSIMKALWGAGRASRRSPR